MKLFTVALFGHRYVEDMTFVETHLEKEVRRLLWEKEYVEFLAGRSGDFDQYAAWAVRKVKRSCWNAACSLVLVLPYPTAEFQNNQESFAQYYDSIEISANGAKAHPKGAFRARNREMIDRADLLLCFVENDSGGAYEAMKYAERKHKTIINIAHR